MYVKNPIHDLLIIQGSRTHHLGLTYTSCRAHVHIIQGSRTHRYFYNSQLGLWTQSLVFSGLALRSFQGAHLGLFRIHTLVFLGHTPWSFQDLELNLFRTRTSVFRERISVFSGYTPRHFQSSHLGLFRAHTSAFFWTRTSVLLQLTPESIRAYAIDFFVNLVTSFARSYST